MKTASFLGVILPQTPVHLVQILNSIFQLPRHTYIQPKFYEDIQLDDERSKPNDNDLDWPGFTGFVAKIYQSQITRFWGQILNSICCLCIKFDISQLWSYLSAKIYLIWCWKDFRTSDKWSLTTLIWLIKHWRIELEHVSVDWTSINSLYMLLFYAKLLNGMSVM